MVESLKEQLEPMTTLEFYKKFGYGQWRKGSKKRKLADITHLSGRQEYEKGKLAFIVPKNKMEFLVRLANQAINK